MTENKKDFGIREKTRKKAQSFRKWSKKTLNIWSNKEKDLKNSKEILRKKPKNPEKIAKKC